MAGLALALPPTPRPVILASFTCVLTILLALGAPLLTFFLVPLLLPLSLAMPTLARDARREVAPSLVALPLALVAGALLVETVFAVDHSEADGPIRSAEVLVNATLMLSGSAARMPRAPRGALRSVGQTGNTDFDRTLVRPPAQRAWTLVRRLLRGLAKGE